MCRSKHVCSTTLTEYFNYYSLDIGLGHSCNFDNISMNCAAQLSIVYLHMVHFYNEKDKNNTHNFFLHYSVVYVCVHVCACRETNL